jgi:hypothetical protein
MDFSPGWCHQPGLKALPDRICFVLSYYIFGVVEFNHIIYQNNQLKKIYLFMLFKFNLNHFKFY